MVAFEYLEKMEQRLHAAIREGRFRQFRMLLELGVNVNNPDKDGVRPLIMIAYVDNEKRAVNMARCLLRQGACMSLSDSRGQTVLHHVISQNKERLLDLLLESVKPQDVLISDDAGDTCLHLASSLGYEILARKLVHLTSLYKLVIDIKNTHGLTPLMLACQRGNVTLARILVSIARASTHMRDTITYRNAYEWLETVLFVPDHLDPFKCAEDELRLITPKPLDYIRPIELREFSINKSTSYTNYINSHASRRRTQSAYVLRSCMRENNQARLSWSGGDRSIMDENTYKKLLPELFDIYVNQQGSYRTSVDPPPTPCRPYDPGEGDASSEEHIKQSRPGALFKGAERAVEVSLHFKKTCRDDGGRNKRRVSDDRLGKQPLSSKLSAVSAFSARKKSISSDSSNRS